MNDKRIKGAKSPVVGVNMLTHYPEKLLNYFFENKAKISNFKRLSHVEIYFQIDKDKLYLVDEFCDLTKSRVERIKTVSWQRVFIFLKSKSAIVFIILFCIALFMYFENFIWKIEISTGNIVSPLEIRKVLYENSIVEGMPKSNVDFKNIEDMLMKNNENLLWCKARVVGGILNIDIKEKITPPDTLKEDVKYEIRAIKDGVAERVYSTKGIVTVTPGQTIKKGDVLIQTTGKGAEGDVFAKVFYESESAYPLKKNARIYTGNNFTNITLNLFNKEFKIKNNILNYNKYDKIENKIGFINISKFWEFEDKVIDLEEDKIIEYAKRELTYKIIRHCDRAIEIKDTIIDKKHINDTLIVKLLLIGVENIAEK